MKFNFFRIYLFAFDCLSITAAVFKICFLNSSSMTDSDLKVEHSILDLQFFLKTKILILSALISLDKNCRLIFIDSFEFEIFVICNIIKPA